MSNYTPPPDTGHSDPERDGYWFGGRRWTGYAAIGMVVVLALCVVIVLVLHHQHHTTSASPAPSSAVESPSPSTSSAPVSSPGGPLPTAPPTSAPTGTSWSLYETVAMPSIPGSGPAHVDGAIATGYAHTPIGALLAAVNEGNRYGLASDTQWRAAAAAMLARGAGYNRWLAVRAAHPYGAGGAVDGDTLTQVAAFQFVSYTPTDAVIQIVGRNSDGSYQVGPNHVHWDGTDWRLVLAANGGPYATVQQVSDLTGFIEWRGV